MNALCRHGGDICERDRLADTITRSRANFDNRHLDIVVSRLRRKISEQTDQQVPIKVVYGVGYTFTATAVVQ